MDSNFFEYLIIIFFIVSALQSFFGKKKKQQKEREAQQRGSAQKVPQQQNRRQNEESAKDILEQMFGLKIPDQRDTEQGKQTKIPSDTKTEVLDPEGYHETSWNPEEEFEDSIGVETVRYEDNANKKYTNLEYRESKGYYSQPERKIEMDKKVEEARKSLQRLPDKIEIEELNTSISVSFVENIKARIREPQTIREYILVSEILNKPKALRR